MLLPWIYRWLSRDHTFNEYWVPSAISAVLVGLVTNYPPTLYVLGAVFAIDAIVLMLRTVNGLLQPAYEGRERRRAAERARLAAEEAAKQSALARIEATKREEHEGLLGAHKALEPAVADIRRHWASCYGLIGDRCSLKDINDAIDNAMAEPSPHVALAKLAALKDGMTRDAVRISTENLYEKLSPYISKIVPREEFARLMREAQARSSSASDYGKRLIELGDWLGSIAGPAKGRWEESRQQEQVAAYERLFATDENAADENPFDEPAENQRASRAG